ncbi:MAG: hypothetical protein U0163_05810 [Gemmatimonadaceae bacterium]
MRINEKSLANDMRMLIAGRDMRAPGPRLGAERTWKERAIVEPRMSLHAVPWQERVAALLRDAYRQPAIPLGARRRSPSR